MKYLIHMQAKGIRQEMLVDTKPTFKEMLELIKMWQKHYELEFVELLTLTTVHLTFEGVKERKTMYNASGKYKLEQH